jgi:hypothetical protein
MRYFKIPLCRILIEKSETDQGHATPVSGTLGQKLGYDTAILNGFQNFDRILPVFGILLWI